MTRLPAAPTLLAVALGVAISVGGCGAAAHGPQPVGPLSAPATGLRTAQWGVAGGRLSILVRNDGARTVRAARAVITARDRHGNAIVTSSGSLDCCGIADLAPGGTAGLYADVGPAVRRVAAVTVRYLGVGFAVARPAVPPVAVADVAMQTGGPATVVIARLTGAGQPGTGTALRVQVVLARTGGRVVAVLSQNIACLAAGQTTQVRLQLAARMPAGTVVSAVTPVPRPAGSC